MRVFHIDVTDLICLDVGASIGGFTDCLLQNGAARVYAVDVGYGQFDWSLRQNPRVVLVEKNARYLVKNDIPDHVDLVTIDLAFISVLKVLPALKKIVSDGIVVSLIKPQFEVARNQVGKKGIVAKMY